MEIPEGQLCEAFDPMMILPEKSYFDGKRSMTTSCITPAYVYLEGSRGKRFLCDFHYFYEKRITYAHSKENWEKISQVFYEKLETIKDTFDKNVSSRTKFRTCWCGLDSFIRIRRLDDIADYCNFHYRKEYYRLLVNGIQLGDDHVIRDERIFMTKTITQEAEDLILA